MAAKGLQGGSLPVWRLRDIPMEPLAGMQGDTCWNHFTGTVQLRLPLTGSQWEGVKEEEFTVRAKADELLVRCRSRSKASNILDSVSGKFKKEINPQGCWYAIERDFRDPFGKGRILAIELAKKTPGHAWAEDGQIFVKELFHRKSFQWNTSSNPEEEELAQGWVKLKVGRQPDVEDRYITSRGWLCSEFETLQSEECVRFRVILDQKKLEDCFTKVPYYKIFAVDCTEQSFRMFIRGDESSPILLGTFGGKVAPDQTLIELTSVTREVEGHRIRGTMETLPCLDVTVVKASDSIGDWEETLIQDEEALNQPQGSLEEFEEQQVRAQREPSPDREDWTPDDWADEQKAKADAAFKEGSYRDAIVYYTRALRFTPLENRLLSNRSAAYLKISKFQLALDDAEKAEKLEPNWSKVYFRKGQALTGLKRFDDAILAYENGQDIDPDNPEWEREIKRVKAIQKALQEKKAAKAK